MRIQVLGPVRVQVNGVFVEVGRPGPRAILGLLALAVGRPLSRAELVDALWGHRPPSTAVNMLQTHVKHLRRRLEPDRDRYARSTLLPAVGDGYALNLPADRVDLYRFQSLLDAAAAAERDGDPRRAADLLGRGLRMWQGPPLADLPSLAEHAKVVALAGRRRAATARYGALLTAAGDAAAAVAVLEEAAAQHPLDETVCAALIRAYQAAGRRAQAFTVYHDTRRRLADQLGVDPGPDLASAHTTLLHQNGYGDGEPAVVARPTPAQLPADIPAFTGRDDYLRQLDGLLADPTTVVICAVSGTAGVGKSTLAVHWAHRVRDRFPDGQLHVNLRGFDLNDAAVSATEALRGFLDAAGVPAAEIPADLPAQTALYRSLLAGKRMLILLDNARDAEQVRPLLPGTPGCLVLVTSRNRLASLVAMDGATPLVLDLPSMDEARQMLTNRLGRRRVTEPGATDRIIQACARLPLALAIVAARAATHPDFTLATLAGQLHTAPDRLDALAGDDAATDVRAVFSWSYHALSEPARRLFRLLGLHPGPTIGAPAAASLAGIPITRVRPLLAELTRTNMINETQPDRYRFHDLLHAYAAELAHAHDPQPDRRHAHRRLLDHYLHTARGIATMLHADPTLISPLPAAPDAVIEPPADQPQASAWLTAEFPAMLNAVQTAAETGFSTHCWQLTLILSVFLERWNRWHDAADIARTALRAAQRQADTVGQAYAHRFLGTARAHLGHFEDGDIHLRHALDLFTQLDDQTGLARTHHGASASAPDPAMAVHHARQALVLYRAIGNRRGQAHALNNASYANIRLGDLHEAASQADQALAIFRQIGDPVGEAYTWDTLGTIRYAQGHRQQAIDCLQQALALHRDTGESVHQATTLDRLGWTNLDLGDLTATHALWNEALTIHNRLGSPIAADGLRARLDYLANPLPTVPAELPDTPPGRKLAWFIDATHRPPVAYAEAADHLHPLFLNQLAEFNKHLADAGSPNGLTMGRYRQHTNHTATFTATNADTAYLGEINTDHRERIIGLNIHIMPSHPSSG